MDEEEILILLKGEDKTKDVEYLSQDNNKIINIKFLNCDKKYKYNKLDVEIRQYSETIDIEEQDIYYKNQIILNLQKAIRFEEYIKVVYKNGTKEVFPYVNLSFKPKNTENHNKNIILYFREISNYVEMKDQKEEENYLKKQYKKLNYVNEESVLSYYINKNKLSKPLQPIKNTIYPFRFNLSQKKALENAYKSNISVIKGPPGTGKTQTILNIITNLAIMQNKTVAVVSDNNEAVKNVKDKLKNEGYDFIVADLGRKEKRERFFENLPQPNVANFQKEEKEEQLWEHVRELNNKLDNLLEKNNEKARLEKELEEFKLEKKYFEEYYKNQNIEKIEELSFYNKTDDRILEFLLDTQLLYEGKIKVTSIYKIKLLFKYGIKSLKQVDKNLMKTILNLQREFYKIKIEKLEEAYDNIKHELEIQKFADLQEEHQNISKKIFNNVLYQKYNGKSNKFNLKTYKYNMNEFFHAYPIMLSTTYSLRDCIPANFLFDYVIIDEASQVNLLAGVLALSCARNVIIVGDEKQLPQIVDKKIKEKISQKEIDVCYDYFENSILSAILRTYGKRIPQKTLTEHYRCHPKIIEFCNKRYYKNELIAISKEEHLKVEKPLVLHYTVEGNHMRKITRGNNKGTFNERELEVIRDEVLNNNAVRKYKNDEIGIETPYRMQADNIQNSLEENIQSDTIHKYQGREKKLMILSTVIDNSNMGKDDIKFVDDPCMVNVAVSRAIEQFVLVTDKKSLEENGKEIKALIKYIKYNQLDSEIVNSQIVSVFDLLYKEYSKKLEKLNRNLLNKSKFKSENIMDTILNNEFNKKEDKDYTYEREILLRNVFRNLNGLNEEEKAYVNNGARVDFVVYNRMDKVPQLFIEVDGFQYHKNNPKQLEKDQLKNNIIRKKGKEILRFETGQKSYDEQKIVALIREKL